MQAVVCRPLGAGEQSYWLRDRVHPIHFALTAQIKGQFTPNQLQQALNLLQQRHPLLRVCIALDETDRPWFTFDSACIPLRVVERQSAYSWQQEVERELATPVDWWQAPLVRVVLVRDDTDLSELIVVCHHSIADGTSATYLICDILQAIATPITCEQSLSIPPSREDLVVGKALGTIFSMQPPPKFRSDSLTVVQHELQNKPISITSGALSPEQTRLLIERCRQEQTSVHAAICAAFLLAIARQNHSQQPHNIKCSSPINLRPYLKSVKCEDVSLCIVVERTSHHISPSTYLWNVARSVKYQLNQSIASENLFEQIFRVQEWLSTNPDLNSALQAFKKQLNYDITVSNLGQLAIEQQYGGLKLEAIYGPAVTTGVENECLVGVATVGERLFFTLVRSERVMLQHDSKTLQEEAIRLLNEAIAAKYEQSKVYDL